jgi:hypothetical protein
MKTTHHCSLINIRNIVLGAARFERRRYVGRNQPPDASERLKKMVVRGLPLTEGETHNQMER